MRSLFLRLLKIALALMVIGFVGIILFNSVVAYTAREIPLDPETRVIVEQAKAEYLRQVPLSFITIRLVVTSVEKCGKKDAYLVLFDVYRWFDEVKGFAKYTDGKGVTGGGTFSDKELREVEIDYFRIWCSQQ